jgi:hypothetical protein
MNVPQVELKKVKLFRGMEGYGLNADVWINGVKCLLAIDEGNGGEMDFERYANTEVVKANVKLLEDHIKTLPKDKDGFKVDMGSFIDNVLVKQEEAKVKAKNEKRMERLYNTAIVIGVPNADRYQFINYKRPLSEVPTMLLQRKVNEVQLTYCKKGVKILNTNFDELGISIP